MQHQSSIDGEGSKDCTPCWRRHWWPHQLDIFAVLWFLLQLQAHDKHHSILTPADLVEERVLGQTRSDAELGIS